MAKAKWIGGFLGLLSGGPIGALAGFVLGALFDTVTEDNGFTTEAGTGYRTEQDMNTGTRNGFLFSLMVLSADVIQADNEKRLGIVGIGDIK